MGASREDAEHVVGLHLGVAVADDLGKPEGPARGSPCAIFEPGAVEREPKIGLDSRA